jgi:hypothetical protein
MRDPKATKHSRTCERRSRNKDLSPRIVVLSSRRHAIGQRLLLREVSCRIDCIEQNVAVTWHGSVAPLLHRAPPLSEMRNHYARMSEHYSTLAEAEEFSTPAYGH